MISHMREFDGKKLTTITHEGIEFDDDDADLTKRRSAAYQDKYGALVKFMNKFYGKAITKVKVSARLGADPAIVSSSEYGQTANMERLMKAQAFAHGQGGPMMGGFKTLEINPRHPFYESLLTKIDFDDEDFKPCALDHFGHRSSKRWISNQRRKGFLLQNVAINQVYLGY